MLSTCPSEWLAEMRPCHDEIDTAIEHMLETTRPAAGLAAEQCKSQIWTFIMLLREWVLCVSLRKGSSIRGVTFTEIALPGVLGELDFDFGKRFINTVHYAK